MILCGLAVRKTRECRIPRLTPPFGCAVPAHRPPSALVWRSTANTLRQRTGSPDARYALARPPTLFFPKSGIPPYNLCPPPVGARALQTLPCSGSTETSPYRNEGAPNNAEPPMPTCTAPHHPSRPMPPDAIPTPAKPIMSALAISILLYVLGWVGIGPCLLRPPPSWGKGRPPCLASHCRFSLYFHSSSLI